ncbi:MAG: glutamine--scyllo-inositol aminotransferase [Acidobacteria bacterium]|nr:MAG: glutamine--scyllo-inositol aminotransferase [Acidobacteriota bacterium]
MVRAPNIQRAIRNQPRTYRRALPEGVRLIRLTMPSIEEDDLRAVREVLLSGLLVQGARVETFERAVARYVGVDHAVAVSNCTAALHLALLALGVGRGDRVAVAAYSWPATANVIVLVGAEPVFVDIEPDTFNMSPLALKEVLGRTAVRAVMPVHTFGGPADMPRILEIAGRFGVPVIEDAACALGTELNGRKAGTWGVIGCFSFHPRKAITTGEGGMVVTNDPKLGRKLRILRNHGLDPAATFPDFIEAGYNLRLTEFQAALGTCQLNKLGRIISKRRVDAARYDGLLKDTRVNPPVALRDSRHVYQSYVSLLPAEVAPRRSKMIAELKSQGIETSIGTYHLPLTTFYRARGGYRAGDFPVTDDIAPRAISLPISEALTREEQDEVIFMLSRQIE